MKYVFEFELPGLPKTSNVGLYTHWAKKLVEAKKWKRLVMEATHRFKPAQPLTSAALTLTRMSSSAPDFDGLVSSFKHIVDGLVVGGILIDDNMSTIGAPTYLWEKCSPKAGKVKIRIEARP